MEQQNHSNENQQFPKDRENLLISEYQKAAEQLMESKEEIKSAWEMRVRRQIEASQGKTSPSLQNTLSIFLGELVEHLRSGGSSNAGQFFSQRGMSVAHGGERATFVGYFLPQLLKEFSLLREVIVEVLLEKNALTHSVRSLIDRTIDTVISLAATEFGKVQQEHIKAALRSTEISNRDLEQFAAVAAHDLKSPLSTISGYLDLLSDETDQESSAANIAIMKKSANRMFQLIDRLLQYAQLAKNDRPFQNVDMGGVVKAVLENMSQNIRETHAQVETGNLPEIKGDAVLLIQLFQNIISNAIKFRSEEPRIRIQAEDRNEMWLFSIQDNGIGFDSKFKEDIFGLYKKLNAEAAYQGTGIGLATCRRVVELHNGTIWAESSPGKGSIFYFTLPKIETLMGSFGESSHIGIAKDLRVCQSEISEGKVTRPLKTLPSKRLQIKTTR
jgi:signal transduction histidine kinase